MGYMLIYYESTAHPRLIAQNCNKIRNDMFQHIANYGKSCLPTFFGTINSKLIFS